MYRRARRRELSHVRLAGWLWLPLLVALLFGGVQAPPAALAQSAPPVGAGAPATYTQQGQCFAYTVPDNVYVVRVALIGGKGSSGTENRLGTTSGGAGGRGARLLGGIPVQPGQVLGVMVAENGYDTTTPAGQHPFGHNSTGGGNGGTPTGTESFGGQGGGASRVWLATSPNAAALCQGYNDPSVMFAVAGGGGGGGGGTIVSGGNGGEAGHDLDGQSAAMNGRRGGGTIEIITGNGGGGATMSAGGAGGTSNNTPGEPGTAFVGGRGGARTLPSNTNFFDGGGGGGGGFFGGGGGGEGGGGSGGGGGAGSSGTRNRALTESLAPTSDAPMVAITPIYRPPDSLRQVSAGYNFSCFLAADKSVACWGDNGDGRATPPAGTFLSISTGIDFACGLKTDRSIACWGENGNGQANAPSGQYLQVSVGEDFACALTVESTLRCWGASDLSGPGIYTSITTGLNYLCAIAYDQRVECWGNTTTVPSTTPTTARFNSISGGYLAPCGIQTDGTGLCWGGAYAPPVPAGTFTAVSSGPMGGDMCWTRADGTITCTTSPFFSGPAGTPPDGAYSAVSTGFDHACGILASGDVVCWGDNTTGEVVPKVTGAWPDPTLPEPPAAISGQPYSFALGMTHMWPAGTLSMIDGVLPPGITLSPSGLLWGTSTAPGRYPFTLQVANGVGPTGYLSPILEVSGPPYFTSASSATFTVGSSGSFTMVGWGPPRPTLSLYGALPPGVRFEAFLGAGSLSGTPQAGSGGVYPLVLVGRNGVSPDAVQSFTLHVNEPPAFTSGDSATFGLNAGNTFTVVAKGYPRPTLSLSGALPDGVTFDAATGILSGTPAGGGGSYPLTFTASNGVGGGVTQAFTLHTAAWAPVAPLPDERLNLAATTGLDGTIYAIAGGNLGITPQSTVFALAPGATSWRSVAPLPLAFGQGRMYTAAATGLDGTIYLIGGVDRDLLETQSSVFAYTPATDSWVSVASLPAPRAGMAVATGADGTIYAIGGWSGRIGIGSTYHNTVFAYTPATDSWRSVADLPDFRRDLAAAAGPDGTIYAIGGSSISTAPQDTVFAYTPATDSWVSVASLPVARTRLAATTGADGTIYAIGGGDTAFALAPGAASWTQLPNLPSRAGLAATTGPGGVIYAIGGQDDTGRSQATALAYFPSGAQSNPAPTTSGLSPAAAQAGQGGFALTVTGANFLAGSTVRVEAAGASTTLTPSSVAADGTSLTVTIPAALVAQPDTLRVTVVNGGPGGGISNLQPLFVTQASTAATGASASTSGTATTGGAGPSTAGSVTVSATGGSGTVAVAIYDANPGSTPSFAATGAYFDAYVAPGSTYTSVQIVSCALGGGSQLYWYRPPAGWMLASNQSFDPTTGCVTVTVDAGTTPSLNDLSGTPFGAANAPAVVAPVSVQSGVSGQQLSFSVSATNPEPGDQVTLAATGLPDGLSIGPTTFDQASGAWVATVSGRVTAPAGTYTASITADDGFSTSASQLVLIELELETKPSLAGNLIVLSEDSASCHLQLNNGASVSASSAVAVNGTNGSALCLNSASIGAPTITVQGGVRNNRSTVQGTLQTSQPAVADPLASLPVPTAPDAACPGAACPDGTTINGRGTGRLLPGTYTAAITGNSGTTLCVAPGVYVIRANWTLNSAALRPYGSAGCPALPSGTSDPGVLLYFAQGRIVVNGSSDLSQLQAMASGPHAELLYWQVGSETVALNGSASVAGGGWYQPRAALTLNGSTRIRAPFVVAATITVNGGTSIEVTAP